MISLLFTTLIVALLLIALMIVVAAAVGAWSAMPLADVLNRMFRKVGLAGPSPGLRAAGVRGLGTVDERFNLQEGTTEATGRVLVNGELWNAVCPAKLAPELKPGDPVEIVYNEDLTVTVLSRSTRAH